MISGSVGRGGKNVKADVVLVQQRLNTHATSGQAKLDVKGVVTAQVIAAIEAFQRKFVPALRTPDGRVDPNGATFRALMAPGAPETAPAAPPDGEFVLPAKPPAMRPRAWDFVFKFTKKHEGYVPHMFAGDKIKTPIGELDDVTCGMGFRLATVTTVTEPWVKKMFYDPKTVPLQTPEDEQLKDDWRAAAKIPREWTAAGMKKYADACKMRMYPAKIYERWGVILRDQKLPTAFHMFREDYKEFEKFPAAAQAMIASFLYGNNSAIFPKMRAAVRAWDFRTAAQNCFMSGMKGTKNEAHKQLLLYAQQIIDEQRNFDELPSI